MITKVMYTLSVALFAVGIFGYASADAPPQKGRIPEQAFQQSRVNLALVPDYVVAYRRDGEVAGYVRKGELFPAGGQRADRLLVLDESLARPVGHMVSGRGFVPIGTPDNQVPEFPKAE